jgi:glutamate 5-kinase
MGTIVVKVGTSSLTDEAGVIDVAAITSLCGQVADVRARGAGVVLVTSGAVAAGVRAFGLPARPPDLPTLQALSAAGQSRLMRVYDDVLGGHGLVAAQVLLVAQDFVNRTQYLHARRTLGRLLELGAVPVVNENDAIADDEFRYGDNDRLAALVAHLVGAELLVLLTDTPGLFTADPRDDADASLIEEVLATDAELEASVGGAGTVRGSGGMASKLAAARIASWSGTRAVIAGAQRPGVLVDAVDGVRGVGTVFHPRERRLPARKLWIAFALASSGRVEVDAGARAALVERGSSLLAAGVTGVRGSFAAGDAVELAGPDGKVFAKGLALVDHEVLASVAGRRTAELADPSLGLVVHADDLVAVPA